MEIHPLSILALQLGMVLVLSLAVLQLLGPVLGRLLEEVCGSNVASAFWLSFTRLMVFIAPMLQVILLADQGENATLTMVLRSTLIHGLAGCFIALIMIGIVIWHIALTDHKTPGRQ